MSLRFAELFAGAGGLSLGLERAGWECVWHAEISEQPRAILQHRWPNVPLLGDVTTLDGKALTAQYGPIDLLSGGSPCQDLSVAGKRKGLEGARSGLFFEQMRLWEETGADLCLWENVDGARSSNNGKDFGEVLRAFVGAAIPVPSDGWRSAGVAAGPLGVAAWRVLDAQFFGVPQRRRRVFVLGTRTGSVDPAEVLSLAESLRGDTQESGEAGEGAADRADASIAFALRGREEGAQLEVSGSVTSSLRGANGGSSRDMVVADTITANYGKQIDSRDSSKGPPNLIFDALNSSTDDIAHSLRSNMDRASGYGAVMPFTQDSCPVVMDQLSPSLKIGTGLDMGQPPCVLAFDAKQDGSDSPTVTYALGSHVSTDTDSSHAAHQGGGPQGFGLSEEIAFALRAGRTSSVVSITGEVTHALTHEGADASEDGTGRGTPVVVSETGQGFWTEGAPLAALRAEPGGMPAHVVANTIMAREANGIPRRLTPRECERLMGWEDDHTLVPFNGKPLSASARYKACGNGVAAVHSHWIGWRLRLALEES